MKYPTNKHQFQVMENVLSEKRNWILYYTTDQKQLVNETADVLQTVWGNKCTSRSDFSLNVQKFKSSRMIHGWSWKWCWVLRYLKNVQRYIEVTRRWITFNEKTVTVCAGSSRLEEKWHKDHRPSLRVWLEIIDGFSEFNDFKRTRSQASSQRRRWKPPNDPRS